jgi:hypothetical protein
MGVHRQHMVNVSNTGKKVLMVVKAIPEGLEQELGECTALAMEQGYHT